MGFFNQALLLSGVLRARASLNLRAKIKRVLMPWAKIIPSARLLYPYIKFYNYIDK